jgi:hypothetical protein
MSGHDSSNTPIRGSTGSTTDPRGARRYCGDSSLARALFTVFFEHSITRAIASIGIPSTRCNRQITAQSSTLTPS